MYTEDMCEIDYPRSELLEKISREMKNDDLIQKTCDLFKVLSEPNRIKIILALQYDELCVCELSTLLNMSQTSVSHQLRQLRNHNIVKSRKINKHRFYTLVDEEIINVLKGGDEYEP